MKFVVCYHFFCYIIVFESCIC